MSVIRSTVTKEGIAMSKVTFVEPYVPARLPDPNGPGTATTSVRVPTGCVGVNDGLGVYVVADEPENVLPLVVRGVLGGSLLPDWTEQGGGWW